MFAPHMNGCRQREYQFMEIGNNSIGKQIKSVWSGKIGNIYTGMAFMNCNLEWRTCYWQSILHCLQYTSGLLHIVPQEYGYSWHNESTVRRDYSPGQCEYSLIHNDKSDLSLHSESEHVNCSTSACAHKSQHSACILTHGIRLHRNTCLYCS